MCTVAVWTVTERASIVAICTSPRAGAPMEQHEAALLVPGVGIDSDRYALRTGWWSDPQWPDQELTLFELRSLRRSESRRPGRGETS